MNQITINSGGLFLLSIIIMVILDSCSSWVSYQSKNGSNDIVIYEDSLVRIQRSTEIIGANLMISHLVDRKRKFDTSNFSIENIGDQVNTNYSQDSFSLYESCGFKEYWYNRFSDIPVAWKNLQDCSSFQIIYYFPAKELSSEIIINTDLDFLIHGENIKLRKADTLFKNTKYHIPQP